MAIRPGPIVAVLGLASLFYLPTNALGGTVSTHQLSRLRGSQRDGSFSNRALQDSSAVYTTLELEFFSACNGELLSDSVLEDGIISQTEFADKLQLFCEAFTVPAAAGTNVACPGERFTSLSVRLQLLFSETICREEDPMQTRMECLNGLDSLNGMGAAFGYIVTPERMPQLEMDIDNLCLKLLPFVFDPNQLAPGNSHMDPVVVPNPGTPGQPNLPDAMGPPEGTGVGSEVGETVESISEVGETVESSSEAEGTVKADETESDSNVAGDGTLDLTAGEVTDNIGSVPVVAEDDNELGTGPIIGIATAAAACLLCFLLVAGGRQSNDADREDDDAPASDDRKFDPTKNRHSQKSGTENPMHKSGSVHPVSASMGEEMGEAYFTTSGLTPALALVQSIADAIDDANWDEVYRLASQLAEEEDLSTLSSVGKQNKKRAHALSNKKRRAHLSKEDLERTKTLDGLVENADWTGLAVTAALYAGEGGTSLYHSSKRSFMDIVAGKSGASKAATELSFGDTMPRPAPTASSYLYSSALGTLTDETGSGTTEDDRALSVGGDGDGSFEYNRDLSLSSNRDRVSPASVENFSRAGTHAGAFAHPQCDLESAQATTVSRYTSDTSLLELRERINDAVGSGDWDKVSTVSSEIGGNTCKHEDSTATEPYKQSNLMDAGGNHECSTQSLKKKLDQAVRISDWTNVSFCAKKIRQQYSSSAADNTNLLAHDIGLPEDQSVDSLELGNVSRLNVSKSADSSDSDAAKRHTIHKLVQAGKWKGVSIMAGLYEMESKASPIGDKADFPKVEETDPTSGKGSQHLVPYWEKPTYENRGSDC